MLSSKTLEPLLHMCCNVVLVV